MKQSTLAVLFILAFSFSAKAHHRKPKWHSAHSPITNVFTANIGIGDVGGFAGITVGFEYERFFTDKGLLSVTLPVVGYLGGTVSTAEIKQGEHRSSIYGGYIAPGLRFHPFGNGHRVDLGIGASMPIGYGNRRDRYRDSFFGETATYDHELFGALLGQLNVNFHTAHSGVIGWFLSAGPVFSNTKATYANAPKDDAYVVFGFRVGGGY